MEGKSLEFGEFFLVWGEGCGGAWGRSRGFFLDNDYVCGIMVESLVILQY